MIEDITRAIQSLVGTPKTGAYDLDTALAVYQRISGSDWIEAPAFAPILSVGDDQWLKGIERDEIDGGSLMPVRRCVVIHATAGASGRSSIEFWRTPEAKGANAHIVIERSGKIIQVRPFNRTCGHAGTSRWVDPNTGKRFTGLNSCSIGIELANAQDDEGALSWARRQPGFASFHLKHRNGGPVREWEAYPTVQVDACADLCRALVARYSLDDITGHDCIAPERKTDPGPAFGMERLRDLCGFKGLPTMHPA